MPITVRLTVQGDELTADFRESAPMVRGSLNCTPSFVEAAVYHAVMAASSIDIPQTGGALRPITVVTKPGTVVHVVMPNASSMRGVAGYRISDVMNGALAQIVPDRVAAAGEGGSTLAWFAGRVDGEPFVYNELVVGTWGGRPGRDGNDGLANPCASIANVPIEIAETEWPIVVERYGFVADSGGEGRYRGGLAIERVWRCVVPGHGAARPLRPAGPSPVRARRRAAGRRVVEPDRPGERRPRAAAADVRGRAATRRRVPPPDGRRRGLGRPARARSRDAPPATSRMRRSRA